MNGTIGNGETEAGATGLALSGATNAIKRFEDLREFSGRNTRALVGYVNNREILSRSVMQLQADFHSRRLARVPNPVTNDLFDCASQQSLQTLNQTGTRSRKNP